jgi:hypothetical protein
MSRHIDRQALAFAPLLFDRTSRELLFALGTAVAIAFDQDWLGMV